MSAVVALWSGTRQAWGEPVIVMQAAREAMVLSLVVALPVLSVAALVGLVVSAFQAASQLQDATISHLPRVCAVAAALVVFGPWMGRQIAVFAERMLLAVH